MKVATIRRTPKIILAALLVSSAAPARNVSSPTLPLQPVADVPLGGNTTRLDYESIESGRHLLFIAHLGHSAVIVLDTQKQSVVSRIGDVSDVHGALMIPEVWKGLCLGDQHERSCRHR